MSSAGGRGLQVDLAKAISFTVGAITAWMSRMGMALDEGYIVLYRSVVVHSLVTNTCHHGVSLCSIESIRSICSIV